MSLQYKTGVIVIYTIELYSDKRGKIPFSDWLEAQDLTTRSAIRAKLDRIRSGNFSTCKKLGNGLNEIKIDIGPGYRIYYSVTELKIILLLCAGIKRTQTKDIDKALSSLIDYKSRGKTNAKK